MAQFTIEIAGHAAAVSSLFDSARDYCRDYLTDKKPRFSITVTAEDLRREQRLADEEAVEEGFRLRTFTDPFLDRAVIQRKLADHLFHEGVLMLHGSAIAIDEEGFLFTAKSGTGKSTHTRFWRETFGPRATMVNDDKPFLSVSDREIRLWGAPWSGKHGLHSNISVPLTGICILERGNENRIEAIEAPEALPMLLHQGYSPPGQEIAFQTMIENLANRVPLWRMTCTKTRESAAIAYRAMAQNIKEEFL